MEASFTAVEQTGVRISLLDWYDVHHRVLPWRRNAHSRVEGREKGASLDMPKNEFLYSIWVCEVMCQQTQVARAATYFQKWMAKWPSVQTLATAQLEEVNELWAGLGYYRRAKSLLDGAQYILNDLGGVFPDTTAQLQKIPGVGAYTGAAVASIAGGEAVAAVDGNVVRVLSRLRILSDPPQTAAAVKLYATLAGQLLDRDRPGDFNQAMMELGARVCTVHQPPSCATCPLSSYCRAYQQQRSYLKAGGDLEDAAYPSVTQYPAKVKKAKKREEKVLVCVVEAELVAPADSSRGKRRKLDSGKGTAPQRHYLLVRRPAKGLLAGLWEFPSVAAEGGADTHTTLQGFLEEQLRVDLAEGQLAKESVELGSVTHVFSHVRMQLQTSRLTIKVAAIPPVAVKQGNGSSEGEMPATKWLTAEEVEVAGLSSSMRKIWELHVAKKARQPTLKQFMSKMDPKCITRE